MVIDEALANGLPVLSTPAGALARAGDAALRVPPGDVAVLTWALDRWRHDAALRRRSVEAARGFRAPGWEAVALAWKQLLDELRGG